MINCTAINSKGRPNEIPVEKWIELGEKYRIVFVCRCLPQNVLAYGLYEKPLDGCAPYEYFDSRRFGIAPEDVQKVIDPYKELGEALPEGVMGELLENSNLELA